MKVSSNLLIPFIIGLIQASSSPQGGRNGKDTRDPSADLGVVGGRAININKPPKKLSADHSKSIFGKKLDLDNSSSGPTEGPEKKKLPNQNETNNNNNFEGEVMDIRMDGMENGSKTLIQGSAQSAEDTAITSNKGPMLSESDDDKMEQIKQIEEAVSTGTTSDEIITKDNNESPTKKNFAYDHSESHSTEDTSNERSESSNSEGPTIGEKIESFERYNKFSDPEKTANSTGDIMTPSTRTQRDSPKSIPNSNNENVNSSGNLRRRVILKNDNEREHIKTVENNIQGVRNGPRVENHNVVITTNTPRNRSNWISGLSKAVRDTAIIISTRWNNLFSENSFPIGPEDDSVNTDQKNERTKAPGNYGEPSSSSDDQVRISQDESTEESTGLAVQMDEFEARRYRIGPPPLNWDIDEDSFEELLLMISILILVTNIFKVLSEEVRIQHPSF